MANKNVSNKVNPEDIDNLLVDSIKAAVKENNNRWLLTILGTLLSILVVWCLSQYVLNGDNLMHGIENFATIISILLSITSIVYAYTTSEATTRQYHNISSAVTEIKAFSNFMTTNNQQILRQIREITKDVATIRAKQSEVRDYNKADSNSIPEGVSITGNNS